MLYAVYLGLAAGSAWFAFAGQWWVLAAYAVLTFFHSGGAAVQPVLQYRPVRPAPRWGELRFYCFGHERRQHF